ncbi:MAG: hypothetical protein ACLGI2_09150 [Acidimicrobiia bacterium]
MIRRLLRILLRLGAVAALGAALAKVLQGRKQPGVGTMPSGEPAVPTGPPKSTQPLVEPSMLKGLDLRKAAPEEETENGQVATADAPPADEPARIWVEPQGAVCPSSHPVKAKLSSSIFHLPGMTAYERTTPDRCYKDAASAESDGLRQAKR